MTIAFTKSKLPYGWLGNMAGGYPVVYNGVEYKSTEHLFQCMRFTDPAIQEEIRAAKNAFVSKIVAKKYPDKMIVQPVSEEDFANMRICIRLKIEQHPALKAELLASGDELIVEDVTLRGGGGRNHIWGASFKNTNGSARTSWAKCGWNYGMNSENNHPSGHELILAEVDLAHTTPRKFYSIWLDPIARNREVKMFNTFFFGSRKSNWNNKGKKLYTSRHRMEFEIEKKCWLRTVKGTELENEPVTKEFDVVTPLASLREFFDVIGYNHVKRRYE